MYSLAILSKVHGFFLDGPLLDACLNVPVSGSHIFSYKLCVMYNFSDKDTSLAFHFDFIYR